MAGEFTLRAPCMTVDVKNAFSEEITEKIGERFPFWEVEEVCFENVFYVFWVSCDDGATVSKERN